MTRDEVVRRLAELIAVRSGVSPLKVAIDGVDAAGKTLFAGRLSRALEGLGIRVVRSSADGFHKPAADRYRRELADPATSYYEDSFDYTRLRSDLLDPLGPGGSRMVRTEAFDVRADRAVNTAWRRIGDDIVLILDGIFLLRPELRDHFDLTIFLHVDFSVSVARAVERDRHLGSPEDALRRYQTRYVPGQRLYLSEARPQDRADVVVDNNDYDRPVILRLPTTLESPR
jgi:uridine kinase